MMPSAIPNLATCKKIGFIVPSSNTVVEPTCNAIISSVNAASNAEIQVLCLYTRIRVKTVGTDSSSTSQFDTQTFITAAQLLADAECDAILWNGTSGMWVGTGLEEDEQLAKAMQDATGVPCSTTTIATVIALREKGYSKISLAVPYTDALTQKLVDFFTSCNFSVLRSKRLELTPPDNLAIGKSPPEDVETVISRAWGDLPDSNHPDAVVVACTNWRGAEVAEKLEREMQATVVDSITVTVWHALRMIGWDGKVKGCGGLLEEV